MAFMEHNIKYGTWIECDGTNGVEVIPAGLVDVTKVKRWADSTSPWAMDKLNALLREYLSGTTLSVQVTEGWGARLSAPGYMDCTDWSVYSNEEAAREALEEMYGKEEEEETDVYTSEHDSNGNA